MSFYENGLTFSLIHWYPLPSHAVKQGHRQWLIPWNRNGGTRLNIDMHTQDTCSCQHKWLFSSSSLHSIHLLVRPSISLQNVLCKTARRLLVIISSGLKISLKPSVLMIMSPQWCSYPPSIVQEKKQKNPKNKNKKTQSGFFGDIELLLFLKQLWQPFIDKYHLFCTRDAGLQGECVVTPWANRQFVAGQ